MINYAAIAVAALEAVQHLLKDLEAGHVTLEDAQARIAAIKAGRATVDAEIDAAARARFGGNKPGI